MTGSANALQHIDEALAAWNDRLAAVADSLLELQADPTYRTVATARLSGQTQTRWQPAAAAMLTLYERFALLRETIERAQSLRKAVPILFGTEAKLAEIHTLLFKPSILLPQPTQTFLNTPQTPVRITPQDLLTTMVQTLASTRATLQELAEAETELVVNITRIEQEMLWLNGQLSSPDAIAIEEAKRMLGELRLTIPADPLGALAGLRTRIQPIVTRVSRTVHAGARLRQRIDRGRPLLAQLSSTRDQATAAAAEAASRVTGTAACPLALETLETLTQWLDRLDRTRRDGKLEAVEVGLRNWQRVAEQTLAQEQDCLSAWQQLLHQRSELCGRLDALRAKARCYGIAESVQMITAAANADKLLKARPANLTLASAAVITYEKLLSNTRGRA